MSDSFIVYVASQYGRDDSPTFADAVAEAKIAQAKRVLSWPFPTPVYSKGEESDALRKSHYFKAATDAQGLWRDAAAHVARGMRMRVWVGTGITMSGDPDNKIFANVVRADLLAQLAQAADEVHVSAGSDDPREYDAE